MVGTFLSFLKFAHVQRADCSCTYPSVPIYDASSKPFMFEKDDFASLQSLPRFKKMGDPKNADLPSSALVTVFFTMNAYSKTRAPPTPSTNAGPRTPASSSSQVDDQALSTPTSSQTLSHNVQFVIYHGQADDFEDE